MTVTLDIPDDLSRDLAARFPNLGRAALEALAAEAYQTDVLSLEQVRRLLGLGSRWEAEAMLSRHAAWPAMTVEDLRSDVAALEKLRASA